MTPTLTVTDATLNDLVVKLTEFAIMDMDADEENSAGLAAFSDHAESAINDFIASRTPASPTSDDVANAALRWIYHNGMVPHPTRPEWVSNAISTAFDGHRPSDAAQPPQPQSSEATGANNATGK